MYNAHNDNDISCCSMMHSILRLSLLSRSLNQSNSDIRGAADRWWSAPDTRTHITRRYQYHIHLYHKTVSYHVNVKTGRTLKTATSPSPPTFPPFLFLSVIMLFLCLISNSIYEHQTVVYLFVDNWQMLHSSTWQHVLHRPKMSAIDCSHIHTHILAFLHLYTKLYNILIAIVSIM